MQVRMPDTDNTEKIQYLHYFLSMALPVLKQIQMVIWDRMSAQMVACIAVEAISILEKLHIKGML